MLLSAVSVLVVAQSSSEIPEGLMNNPVHPDATTHTHMWGAQTVVRLLFITRCPLVSDKLS